MRGPSVISELGNLFEISMIIFEVHKYWNSKSDIYGYGGKFMITSYNIFIWILCSNKNKQTFTEALKFVDKPSKVINWHSFMH